MDLDEIATADQDQKQKSDQYRQALEEAVAGGDAAACRRFVDHGAGAQTAATMAKWMLQCSHFMPTSCSNHPTPLTGCRPAVLSDAVPLVLSRQLLMAFAQSLPRLEEGVQQEVAT
jgi:COP9 signalosome complex subunit 4